MLGLKEFMDAMSASWPVALAISIGTLAILAAHSFELSYLETLPNIVFALTFIAWVLSTSVLAVSLLQHLLHYLERKKAEKVQTQLERKHIKGIEALPPEEAHILVWATVNNKKVFLAEFNAPQLEPLIAKGYVIPGSGTHSILEWPYTILDHI